jgi:hypothetical protein
MVFHEATRAAGKLGAQEIIDWYRSHTDVVRVEPTQTFQDEMTLRENPGHKPARDLGERQRWKSYAITRCPGMRGRCC